MFPISFSKFDSTTLTESCIIGPYISVPLRIEKDMTLASLKQWNTSLIDFLILRWLSRCQTSWLRILFRLIETQLKGCQRLDFSQLGGNQITIEILKICLLWVISLILNLECLIVNTDSIKITMSRYLTT